MKDKKSKFIESKNKVYLWIIGMLDFLILFYEPILGGISFLVLIYLLFYNWKSNRKKNEKWQNYIETLSSDIDSASKYAILNLPFPLTLIDLDGEIKWYNSKFIEMIDQKEVIGEKINSLFNKVDIDEIIHSNDEKIIKKNSKTYRIYSNIVRLNSDNKDKINYIMMLYWVDITDQKDLEMLIEDKKPVIASVEIDNYDECLGNVSDEERPILISKIQKEINLWSSRINGFIQKTQDDKYTIIFEKKYLKNLEAKKFTILDSIRELNENAALSPTLSMGVSTEGKDFLALEKSAKDALELSLARGGDQVSVYKNDDYKFYGGKSKAVQKKNRIKARVVAHALIPIIEESSNVIIMGHVNPDMDCYGASIGMYSGIESRGKEVFILLNNVSEGIEDIHKNFIDNADYKFINNEQADELITDNTLLVVVDTHRPSFTENPELLEKIKRVVMIDHHRRGKEVIEDTLLTYQEPYASSACELVAEVLQYLNEKISINKIEAEALLAGIYVDTKNFSFKTGVRTFEVASFLRKLDADTSVVKQLFQYDLENYINKSYIVSNAEIYYSNIAISLIDKEDMVKKQIIAAQGADELLNIRGIEVSFVIGMKEDGVVFVSGRSLGDISVQLIMEKLGGGGHLTVAGTQIENKTIYEVKDEILVVLDELYGEGGINESNT
jgi:c-di-AMP phosphodiesterase-like protein